MTVSVSVFAPGQSGLICGYLFDAQGHGRPLDLNEAARWFDDDEAMGGDAPVAGPPQDGGSPLGGQGGRSPSVGELPSSSFVWLHFNAANVTAEKWLLAHLPQAEHCFETLREGVRSTRLEVVDQALVAVVNDVVYDFAQRESLQVATLWMSVERRRVISVRMQPLRAIDRLRIAVKAGETFASPLSLVDHLLRDQADELIAILRSTATKVDVIEDQLLAGRLGRRRVQLGALRRNLLRLQRLLAPEPAAMFRLLSRPPQSLGPQDWEELRHSTEEFSVVLRDLAAQQERIKLLQEEIAASIEERTGRTLFVLTAVTVVALPMNVIAGLFGMNVGGIPFAQDKAGFWTMVAVVLLASGLLAWLLFRRRDD